MAKVTKLPVKKYTYMLEMSEVEARTLLCILGKIGGHPVNSARKHTESMFDELINSGLHPIYRECKGVDLKADQITFLYDDKVSKLR